MAKLQKEIQLLYHCRLKPGAEHTSTQLTPQKQEKSCLGQLVSPGNPPCHDIARRWSSLRETAQAQDAGVKARFENNCLFHFVNIDCARRILPRWNGDEKAL